MNRTQKQSFIEDFTKGIQESKAFALMSFSNLTVEQMTSFRLSLSKKEVKVKVVKNTLAQKVLDTTAFKDISKDFIGPTLVAYSAGDPVLTAKAIMEWANKENFNIKLKSGAALGQVMSGSQLTALSKLPGRNELLVSFLWALNYHQTSFANALSDAPRKLGYALGALKAKKEKESA